MASSTFTWREGLTLLNRYLGSERSDLRSLLVFSVLAGVLSLVFPLTAQVLINQVASGAVLQSLSVLAILLLVGLLLFTWLESARFAIVEFLMRRLFVRRARRFVAQLAHADEGAADGRTRLELSNRFFDVVIIDKTLQVLLVDGVSAVLGAFAGMTLLALYHPALLGFDLLLIVTVLLPFLWVPAGLRSAHAESSAKYRVAAWLEEVALSSTWPRAHGGHEFANTRLGGLIDSWLEHRSAHFRVTFRQYVSYLLVQSLGTAGLLVIGGLLVIEGQLSLGQLVAAELVLTATVAALARFGKLLPKVYDLLVALKKVEAVEGELPQEPMREGALGDSDALNVSLQAVELQVGTKPVDLSLARGQIVAWRPSVRAHQILDLLFGLRRPANGVALFDGLPIEDLSLTLLRDRIGYIDGADVIAGSVKDNLRIANASATVEEMWSGLETVGLHERVMSHGEGLTLDVRALNEEEQIQLTVAREQMRQPGLLLVRGIDLLPEDAMRQVASALSTSKATRVVVTNHPDRFGGDNAQKQFVEEAA